MTVREREVNLSYEELESLCGEKETKIHTLRKEIRALELERDQALRGLHLLTEALRRRGCCEHDVSSGSL